MCESAEAGRHAFVLSLLHARALLRTWLLAGGREGREHHSAPHREGVSVHPEATAALQVLLFLCPVCFTISCLVALLVLEQRRRSSRHQIGVLCSDQGPLANQASLVVPTSVPHPLPTRQSAILHSTVPTHSRVRFCVRVFLLPHPQLSSSSFLSPAGLQRHDFLPNQTSNPVCFPESP